VSSLHSGVRWLHGGLLLSLLLAPASAGAGAPPTALEERGSKARAREADLAVEASSWTLPSRPIRLKISQRGALAGRKLAIYVFVDGNQLERIGTGGDRTRATVALPALAPGPHTLVVRAGTESAEASFRVIPWSWASGLLLLALLTAALTIELLRARAKRRG
jgi:hypothetical protein